MALDRRYAVFSCSGVMLLPDGSITFHGASADKTLPGGVRVKGPSYAITGGTRTYSGARGTATRTGNGKVDKFVLELTQ